MIPWFVCVTIIVSIIVNIKFATPAKCVESQLRCIFRSWLFDVRRKWLFMSNVGPMLAGYCLSFSLKKSKKTSKVNNTAAQVLNNCLRCRYLVLVQHWLLLSNNANRETVTHTRILILSYQQSIAFNNLMTLHSFQGFAGFALLSHGSHVDM